MPVAFADIAQAARAEGFAAAKNKCRAAVEGLPVFGSWDARILLMLVRVIDKIKDEP
jgi:hypothetical protein